jgi:chaperonin GroES
MKVFSAIYKRLHISLRDEFKKLRRLCCLYRTQEEYERVVDCEQPVKVKDDYRDLDMDVVPVSDTADVSDTQRLMVAEGLKQLLGQGLNDKEIYKRYLEALQVPEAESVLEKEDTGPTMQEQMQQLALQLQEREIAVKEAEVQIKAEEMREKLINLRANSIKAIAEAEAKEAGTQLDVYQAQIQAILQVLQIGAKTQSANNTGAVRGVAGRPDNQGNSGGGQPAQGGPAGYAGGGGFPQ